MDYPAPEIVSPPPEPATKLVVSRTANDTLTHHLLLSFGTAYTGLFGSLDSATSLPNRLGGGYSIIGGVGYGLSRNVETELEGSFAAFGADSGCPSCSAKAYDAIVAIRYHLVQGERFDPWVRFGFGASILRFDDDGAKRNYIGFQWLNATVGGDWYMTRTFAFGPLVSLAMTSYLDHPSGANISIAFKGLVGINVTFDPSGK